MKKFNVKFNRPKQEKRFKKFLNDVRKQDRWKNDAAEIAIADIVQTTRKQKFIKDGSKQPALSDSWLDVRDEWAGANGQGTSYGDEKSNLTLTGQLLESLKRKKHKTKVIIEPTGKRMPYVNPNTGKKVKKTPTNKKLAQYLKEQGRFFMGYNDKMKKAIKKSLTDHIRRNLKDFNNR